MKDELLRSIDKRSDDIVDLTQRLIRTPSENPPGDEREIAKLVVQELNELGINETKLLEKVSGRPNVIACLRGSNSKHSIILNTHIDTKPVGELDKWIVPPFSGEIINGEIYGRGACDTKGSVAAIITAAAAIKQMEPALPGDIVIVLNADEESDGKFGMDWLVNEIGLRADAAIVAEPSGINNSFEYLDIALRGVYAFDLVVHGTQMHSSLSDLKGGINPSLGLAKTLSRFKNGVKIKTEHRLYPQGNTMNPGVFLRGGVWYGILSGLAIAGNDIRTVPGTDAQNLRTAVDSFITALKNEDQELEIESKEAFCIDPAEISEDQPIVRSCVKAYSEVFGHPPKIGGFPGATDARFMINYGGFPAVPAFGPGLLHLAHGPNERIPIVDVVRAAKVYALASLDFLEDIERSS